MMKIKITLLLLLVCGAVSAQSWNITGTKTRFANGLGIPVKTITSPGAADTALIFINLADTSTPYWRFHGALLPIGSVTAFEQSLAAQGSTPFTANHDVYFDSHTFNWYGLQEFSAASVNNSYIDFFDGYFKVRAINSSIANDFTINASGFDMASTTAGFLSPRMTTTQRNAISGPATGLEIFNTITNQKEFYNGVAWVGVGVATFDASLTAQGATNMAFDHTVKFNNKFLQFDSINYYKVTTKSVDGGRATLNVSTTSGTYLNSGSETVNATVQVEGGSQAKLSYTNDDDGISAYFQVNNSGKLRLQSNEGVDFNGFTVAERDAITSPTAGRLVYLLSDSNYFSQYNGAAWVALSGASSLVIPNTEIVVGTGTGVGSTPDFTYENGDNNRFVVKFLGDENMRLDGDNAQFDITFGTTPYFSVHNGTSFLDNPGHSQMFGFNTSTPTEAVTVEGNVIPATTATHQIGTSSNHWLKGYIDTLYTLGSSIHLGNAHLTDSGYAAGKVLQGSNSGKATWVTLTPQWDIVSGGINYSGGNVGIGTALPAAKLDVTGTAKISSTLTISSLNQNSVPFIGASGLVSEDNTNFTWNNTTKTLKMRGDSTDDPIEVHTARSTGIGLYVHTSTSNTRAPTITSYRSRGSEASPSTILSGDNIGRLSYYGYNGSSYVNGGSNAWAATENWDLTHNGSFYSIIPVLTGGVVSGATSLFYGDGTAFRTLTGTVGTFVLPTATVQINPSTATTGTGQLKLLPGIRPSTAAGEDGLIVYDTAGSVKHLYFNAAGTYYQLDQQGGGGSGTVNSGTSGQLTYYGSTGTAVSGTTTGTGVLTALGVNTGSAGAMVLFNGAGGTPSSLTLTNATGLPVGSITGLGTGVATWLATPSSANLITAVTDETGSGALVFANSPNFTGGTPIFAPIRVSSINDNTNAVTAISIANTTGVTTFNRSVQYAYVAKTANYTATTTDYTIDCTANTFQVTLPTAVGCTGRVYYIVNSGAGTITIGTTSSQTFANVTATPTTLTMATIGTVAVQSNGANWNRLSNL